ncbi:MAG: stage II sporulation protein M [Armatimonadota bacterium]
MDERAFIERRRPEWEHLAELLRRTSTRGGLQSLSGSDLSDIGKLYRRVTSDLSYVKSNSVNDELIIYLNELAGRAHGVLYIDQSTDGLHSVIQFLLRGFPILFRAKKRFMAIAAALMILSCIFSAAIVAHDSRTAGYFIPTSFQDAGRNSVRPDNELPASFSSFLMTHNIQVSLFAFAGGISFGIFTAFALIQNGLMLGAFLIKPYPFLKDPLDIIAFLFPHGFIELTAIAIAGGAGLMLGWSLIAPGNLTRWDSLRKASSEAIPLMGGVVAMLVVAGCIESFVSRTSVPRGLQLTVAAVSAVLLVVYFGFAGRRETKASR